MVLLHQTLFHERLLVVKKKEKKTKRPNTDETTQASFFSTAEDAMIGELFQKIVGNYEACEPAAVSSNNDAAGEVEVAAATSATEAATAPAGEVEGVLAPALNPRECEDALSKEFYKDRKEELRGRVSERRFEHIMGVVKTAKKLAKIYGVDPRKAKLAGLLHDWDKGYNDAEIRARARELGLQVPEIVIEDMPQTLHGMTAATALGIEYPCIPEDVLQAIYRHTSGAVGMSPLDMVVYVADCIEPGRQMEVVEELRELVGKVELEELFFRTHGVWMTLVVGRKTTIHPDTLNVWNYYAKRYRERRAAERAAAGLPALDADPNKVAGAKSK